MKLNIPENPKSCRISTYLTPEETADLAKIVGDESTASWLRRLVLQEIRNKTVIDCLKPDMSGRKCFDTNLKCNCEVTK